MRTGLSCSRETGAFRNQRHRPSAAHSHKSTQGDSHMVTKVVELCPPCDQRDIRLALLGLRAVEGDSVLVDIHDRGKSAADGEDRLQWLAQLYGAVAAVHPTLKVLPLFASLGWNTERIKALSGSLDISVDEQDVAGIRVPTAAWRLPGGPFLRQPTDTKPSGFAKVAVGGTFDRLHAGHRLLLAATAVTATEAVYVGITADELLKNKKHAELLQSYQDREAAALAFLQAVNPALTVASGSLSDPQAPTAAELDPAMEAIVVSKETVPGAEAINRKRVVRGFKPLEVVVVGLVGDTGSSKLSSTALRESEAATATAALRKHD